MIWRCPPCRKPAYSSFRVANKVRRRSNRRNGAGDEGMVYWCPTAGGWHVTSWARGDADRTLAAAVHRQAGDNRPVLGTAESGPVRLGTDTARRRQLALTTAIETSAPARPQGGDKDRRPYPSPGGPPLQPRCDLEGDAVILPGQQRPEPDPRDDTPTVVVPDGDREVVLDDDEYERAS